MAFSRAEEKAREQREVAMLTLPQREAFDRVCAAVRERVSDGDARKMFPLDGSGGQEKRMRPAHRSR